MGLSAGPLRTRAVALLIAAIAVATAAAAPRAVVRVPPADADALAPYQNLPLWPAGSVPMASGDGPLDRPFLTVFLPPEGRRNGGAVVVAPGGSNIMLMYGAEGLDVAERFNEWGVTAFVLTYRLSPKYNDAARVLDGRRALQLVRAHAAAWKISPANIGYIGFSAGSNMGRPVTASSRPGDPAAPDPVDRVSSRPDYLALVYGAGSPSPGEALQNFPPMFLISAAADTGPSLGNAQLFADLTRAGATAEIHVYQKGHHGFGSGYGTFAFADWMPRLQHFLMVDGFLPGAK